MTADAAAVAGYADRIMAAIDTDIAAGRVPAAVASFSALHDYVECLGYFTAEPAAR